MKFTDLLWDPNKNVFFFLSVILNITWLTGFWKTGLTFSAIVLAFTIFIQYFNGMKIITPNKDLSVLVTGTSTGIGADCVDLLSKQGFHVFAAQRNISGKKSSELVTYIALDVESEESIVDCVKKIEDSRRTLFAVVNNAGIGSGGLVEFVDVKEVKKCFEVNVFGLLRLTQLLIPMLRECAKKHSSAKVINVSSVAGVLSLPGSATYAASKWAVQALTAGLRNELVKFQIRVCGINPGYVKTEFGNSLHERFGETIKSNPKIAELYPTYLERWKQNEKAGPRGILGSEVAEMVGECLVVRVPKEINLIGNETTMISIILSLPKILQNQIVRKMFAV